MTNTRRDIFKFAGGAVAGAFLTPAPWRLITDTALWSENWPGIPRPARGEIKSKFTNCALCPAGCAVRARCVGEQPVALAPVRGGMCPFGLTAHHLPYHPARLKQGPVDEAMAAVKARGAEGLAVLDLNPGRTASWTYRRAMAALKGVYLAPSTPTVAYDLAAAKVVLSIGVPLLDGWGTPAAVHAARKNIQLIQAEAVESRTAIAADRWIPLAAGMEGAYAREILDAIRGGQNHPVAKDLPKDGSALVLGDAPEIAEINRLLGAYGKTIVAAPEVPVPDAWKKVAAPATLLADVANGSIRTLLIDESAAAGYVAWDEIAPKLMPGALVVTFAATSGGYARHSKYALPVAVFPEVTGDIPQAIDQSRPALRIAAPLVPAPAGMADPVELVAGLAGIAAADALKERVDAIHKAGEGTRLSYSDGKETPVKELTADDFYKSLLAGGEWANAAAKAIAPAAGKLVTAISAAVDAGSWPLIAVNGATNPKLISPLMTKLYQESGLLLAPNRVALHPADARPAGLGDGGRATLETRKGRCAVEVTLDASVPRGAVLIGGASGIHDICSAGERAKVVRA
jgi:hypothetical protein